MLINIRNRTSRLEKPHLGDGVLHQLQIKRGTHSKRGAERAVEALMMSPHAWWRIHEKSIGFLALQHRHTCPPTPAHVQNQEGGHTQVKNRTF